MYSNSKEVLLMSLPSKGLNCRKLSPYGSALNQVSLFWCKDFLLSSSPNLGFTFSTLGCRKFQDYQTCTFNDLDAFFLFLRVHSFVYVFSLELQDCNPAVECKINHVRPTFDRIMVPTRMLLFLNGNKIKEKLRSKRKSVLNIKL